VSLRDWKWVFSWVQPITIRGAIIFLSLRKTVTNLGTLRRSSVAMVSRSLSNEATCLKGGCARMRPKDAVMIARSSNDHKCGGRSTRSNQTL
jgi:hypothetical protein